MKIAVLLFGQPRFLNKTKNFIKEEFDLPGHDVHYYFHFWDHIGFIPEGKEKLYDRQELIDQILQITTKHGLPGSPRRDEGFNDIVIEDYTELDNICKKIDNYRKLFTHPLPRRHLTAPLEALRYKFGQHLSIQTCFNKIKEFEQQRNFKYDIIVKTRTDIVYKPQDVYSSVEEYYNEKNKYYTNIDFNEPTVKCRALRIINDKKYHLPIHTFTKEEIRLSENKSSWIKYVDNYQTRPAFNDWTLIANRAAAEFMYGCWYDNYFITLIKDIVNTKNNKSLISQSEHSLQGQFLLNYNIKAERSLPRRDIRVIDPSVTKQDFDTKGTITPNLDLREQLLKYTFK